MVMFSTRGSPSSEGYSKQVMVIPAMYSNRFPRNSKYVTEGSVITKSENIEIRYLRPLGPTIQYVSETSEDGLANTSALCVNRLLLSLRETLKAVSRYLEFLLRYPCPWARVVQRGLP